MGLTSLHQYTGRSVEKRVSLWAMKRKVLGNTEGANQEKD